MGERKRNRKRASRERESEKEGRELLVCRSERETGQDIWGYDVDRNGDIKIDRSSPPGTDP
jgi:hypothetical protein